MNAWIPGEVGLHFAVRPAKAKTFCCPAKANVTDVLRAGLIMNNIQYFKLKAFLANSNNRIFKYTALYVNGKIH